jgi:tyrosine-protein phosphatase YwqE
MEDSLSMLRDFYGLGYRKIITTPHIMGDSFRNTPEIILAGLEKLREALALENIPIEIHAAAEYYLDYDFEKKLDEGSLLTFGKNYLLFEISFMNPPDNLHAIIFKLQTSGYKPVLAHPERYPFWHRDFEKFESLKDKGVLFQLNINSLTGYYSAPARKISQVMIDRDMIELLGSDCHHPGHIRLMQQARHEKALHQLLGSGRLLNAML